MDAELRALLRAEALRHADAAEKGGTEAVLRAIHALKGAFALAGERELSADLTAHHASVRDEEEGALSRARVFLRALAERTAGDEEVVQSSWPIPPARLRPSAVDPEMREFYESEVQDRLLAVDEALDEMDEPATTLQVLYRHVHSVKGAASAVRDEPMAWFCHGLESRLDNALAEGQYDAGVREVRRHRRALHGLLHSQAATLTLLRGHTETGGVATSMPPTRGSVRIGTDAFDALVERVSLLGGLRERDTGIAHELAALERELRDARHELADALRLIGPPKPWGAPAAAVERIERVKLKTDRAAATLLRTRHAVQEVDAAYGEAVRELGNLSSSMRRGRVSELFRRVEESFRVLADRENVQIAVYTEGGDELVDRRILDALGAALVHLARNSIAHGLGPRGTPSRRAALAVSLRARRAGNRVILDVEDDGVGVDLLALAREAVLRGFLPRPEQAGSPAPIEGDTTALLSLLFFPGFSTESSASELAGRGLGLDIVAQAVRRLGGTVRLDSAESEGFHVTLDIPAEAGLLSVLWFAAGSRTFGLFASDVVRIAPVQAEVRSLSEVLGEASSLPARACVTVATASGQEATFRVDSVPKPAQVFVRPLGPLASSFGPFSHAVGRPDGSLRLVLDVPQLVSMSAA